MSCHHDFIELFWNAVRPLYSIISRFKVQGSLLFVTYTIIQGIIGSEMLIVCFIEV